MANTNTSKDETLDPIRYCVIPQTVMQLKAFLGSTQQMAYYVPYYALVAAPLHKLTRKGEIIPSGAKWIPGSDYDMAFRHVRSLVLDRPLYIWKKTAPRTSSLKEIARMRDGTHVLTNTPISPQRVRTKVITFCSANCPKRSSNGYPKLGHHTKRRAYPSSTKKRLREFSH
jgi:hypothetical protein